MWHIYILFAVLFRGAYCIPLINTAEHSPCTVVINHFGEQVETLEVKWNSSIRLSCDASCVGPMQPQPVLTWFYRVKNQSKLINIEKLFRSPKFETYPTNFHRKNELVIRDFGPNEETDFICKGAFKKQRLEAKVGLIGTDCLLKYYFRCKLGNKCIDRAYLCNQHNECPDGEDEVGCAKRPTVRVEPEKITVTMGTTGILRCIVTGVPAPTITWLKSRQELSTNHQIDGNILRITQATMDDRGIYVCRAENIAGSDQDCGIVEVERRMRPKIDLYPEDTQTVSVGCSALFLCRVIDGDPPPKVTWSRVGGLQLTEHTDVMDNGVIMFKGTTQQEQGSYICTATNDMGTTTTTATLIVQGPPTIVIQPSKMINAIVGQRVRMECIAQGEPIPSVYWIDPLVPRLGDIVPPAGFPQKEGTAIFEITNVGKENTGFYTCVAQNAGGRTEDTVQLFVQKGQPAEVKIAGPGTLSIVDGGSVELTCSASAILNPQIRWRRREGPLPPGHSLRGGILSLPQLTVEYGGEYICSTSSPEGSYQASVFIIVTERMRPKIDLYPEDTQTVSVGCSALFVCRVIDGEPPTKVTWSRVGGLQLTERTDVMDNGVIMFKGTTQEEQGFYVCTASNDMGTTTDFARLIVQGPPKIVIQPNKTINAIVGQRVRMECIGQGEPIPSVYWINPLVPRFGDIVPQAGFPQKEGTAIFEITNVGKENTGFYTCVAQNAGGRTEDTVQLFVQEDQRTEVKIAGPGTLSVVVGGSVELTCTASAILSPLIRWRRREGPLPIGHSLRGGILSIPRLTVEYGGEYICSTSSPEGSYQASVFIIVTAKSCEFQCRNGTCISSTKQCDGIPDCPDGDDEICEKKKITFGTGINEDGDNGLLSTTDGVTDNTGEFTDTTTPFDYDLFYSDF